jgi:hypothetical protein
MRLLFASALLALVGSTASATAPGTGDPFPALQATHWYNSPALTDADLAGKAVLVDVFRTW